MFERKTKPICISLPISLWERFKKRAKEEKLSDSALGKMIIEKWFDTTDEGAIQWNGTPAVIPGTDIHGQSFSVPKRTYVLKWERPA